MHMGGGVCMCEGVGLRVHVREHVRLGVRARVRVRVHVCLRVRVSCGCSRVRSLRVINR